MQTLICVVALVIGAYLFLVASGKAKVADGKEKQYEEFIQQHSRGVLLGAVGMLVVGLIWVLQGLGYL